MNTISTRHLIIIPFCLFMLTDCATQQRLSPNDPELAVYRAKAQYVAIASAFLDYLSTSGASRNVVQTFKDIDRTVYPVLTITPVVVGTFASSARGMGIGIDERDLDFSAGYLPTYREVDRMHERAEDLHHRIQRM
ncbi:MAG: hypothetical protein ACOX5R_12930 [bacterium]|jgi:hypothetical protein